jgi:hypothetical protein
MSREYRRDEDDGRVVADMRDVERQPLLIPRPDMLRKGRKDISPEPERISPHSQQPVILDPDELRAMIGGAVSAGLLVVGVIAAAFAALILIILKVWG